MRIAYMASMNRRGHYTHTSTRENVVKYITQDYTIKPPYFGCIAVDEHDIAGSMTRIAQKYQQDTYVRIRHIMLAFCPNEPDIDPASDLAIACELGQLFIREIGWKFQALYAVHQDPIQVRLHVAFNPVSYVDGTRLHLEYKSEDDELYHIKLAFKSIAYSHGVCVYKCNIPEEQFPEGF